MGRSSWRKKRHEKVVELPQHDSNEGTSAWTRPFDYDEIMLKRDSKKLNENAESVKEENIKVRKIAKDSLIQNDFNVNKSDGGNGHGKEFLHGHEKDLMEGMEKRSSHKKIENEYRRNDSISKQKTREHEPERRLKSEVRKDTSIKDEGKHEKQTHAKRKTEQTAGASETVDAKKHSRDLAERDRHVGRSEGKPEREDKRKHQTRDDEQNRERHTTKKHEMRKGHASETSDRKKKEPSRSHHEDSHHASETSDRKKKEPQRSHHEDSHHASETKDRKKKEPPRSHHEDSHLASEISDRKKKEASRSHHEDSHHKRRCSHSREREDRHRRSISLSPRVHKRASHHVSEHELSSHGVKGRSGRQHSDDRSKVTSNGSSGHHKRHGGSSSGLGGYSPRKRKSDAAVRTPSPVHRTTEKRTAKWDLSPAETEIRVLGSASSNSQASSQTVSLNMHAIVNAVPSVSVTGKPLVVASTGSLSFDSVQLTEATRPMRRLYVDNVPASASEKALMEFFNNILLSGINHIRRTKPCISCIIHKGKEQALVEFLTPQDASAALSFDGSTFSGSILKIRRPKDFVEVTSEPEKLEATVTTVNDIADDSHHKIFIGGISKALSSEMFAEIANAFGPLKAYQFDTNEDLGEQYAFLEYIDQSVTNKACAGLNGMKLGGEVITAVEAVLDGFSSGNGGDRNSCIIPELARPLLQKPTQVLKLKNLFPEDFSSLSEAEVEEVLEDVRLECSRFGTIKSVKFVKHANNIIKNGENKIDYNERETGTGQNLVDDEINVETTTMEEVTDQKPDGNPLDNELCRQGEFKGNTKNEDKNYESLDDSNSAAEAQLNTEMAVECPTLEIVDNTVSQEESNYHSDSNPDYTKSEATNVDKVSVAEENANPVEVKGNLPEGDTKVDVEDPAFKSESIAKFEETPKEEPCSEYDKVTDNIETEVVNVEKKLLLKEDPEQTEGEELPKAVEGSAGNVRTELDAIEKDENSRENNLDQIFEPGCVLVEYRRTEASCTAAHSIHGRLFDNRFVTVEYVDPYLYRVSVVKGARRTLVPEPLYCLSRKEYKKR